MQCLQIEPEASAAKQSDSKIVGENACSDFVDSYTKEKTNEMEKLLEMAVCFIVYCTADERQTKLN